MARLTGREGQLYVALAAGAAASPVAFTKHWTLDITPEKIDVTAFGDTNKVKLAGLGDVTGTYDGFYDDASDQLYAAAVDGTARKFYLYTKGGNGFKGEAVFDFSVDTASDAAVAISGGFEASSAVTRI